MIKRAFTVMGKPKGKGRPRMGRGVVYTPKDTLAYEQQVRDAYFLWGNSGEKMQGAIICKITAYFAIPKRVNKNIRREMENGNLTPKSKPDVDNIAKVILDALNGVAFDDDSQVCVLEVTKLYGECPRVYVELTEMG